MGRITYDSIYMRSDSKRQNAEWWSPGPRGRREMGVRRLTGAASVWEDGILEMDGGDGGGLKEHRRLKWQNACYIYFITIKKNQQPLILQLALAYVPPLCSKATSGCLFSFKHAFESLSSICHSKCFPIFFSSLPYYGRLPPQISFSRGSLIKKTELSGSPEATEGVSVPWAPLSPRSLLAFGASKTQSNRGERCPA